MFIASNWYWLGSPGLYSSSAGALIPASNSAYVAWLAGGNSATPWPKDSTGAVTAAALDAVLTANGLPPTGLAPLTAAQLVAYAFGKVGSLLATARSYTLATGVAVKCDATTATEANLVGLNAWGTAAPTATQPWIDNFGAVTVITGAQAVALAESVVAYGQSVYAALAAVAQEIAAASVTTTAQIDAASWPV